MTTSADIPKRKAAPPWLGGFLVVTAAIWSGCSIEKHYEVLSFFFDGVPDPNAPAIGTGSLFNKTNLPIVSVHRPYDIGGCDTCHTDISNLSSLRGNAQSCMNCHDGIQDAQRHMHGPVVAMACLLCHNPHESPYPSLLRQSSPVVCKQCHENRLLIGSHPEDESRSDQDCLGCHSGHGGPEAGFLLDSWPTAEGGGG